MSNKVLSEKELATELGLSIWTIRTLRLQRGLPHIRTSPKGRVLYNLQDVLAWWTREQVPDNNVAPKSKYGELRVVK